MIIQARQIREVPLELFSGIIARRQLARLLPPLQIVQVALELLALGVSSRRVGVGVVLAAAAASCWLAGHGLSSRRLRRRLAYRAEQCWLC